MSESLPIILRVDDEDLGQVEVLDISAIKGVGTVVSIQLEKEAELETEPEEEGTEPDNVSVLSDIEKILGEEEEGEEPIRKPTTQGYMPSVKQEGKTEFRVTEADLTFLRSRSSLRTDPRFFIGYEIEKVQKSRELSSPVEAYPTLPVEEEKGPGPFSEEEDRYAELKFDSTSFNVIGQDAGAKLMELAEKEGEVLKNHAEASGFEELRCPYYLFDEKHEDPNICTLHSIIRVWYRVEEGKEEPTDG